MMRDGLFLWGIHDALGAGDELLAPGERLSIEKKQKIERNTLYRMELPMSLSSISCPQTLFRDTMVC
jgi:hypothetical protein